MWLTQWEFPTKDGMIRISRVCEFFPFLCVNFVHVDPVGSSSKCTFQHLGPCWAGSVLRNPPMLPLEEYPVLSGVEHGWRRERN